MPQNSTYYGYIRVSTAKQGKSVSLPEQKSAIESFASRNGLTISQWFEEKETAAKRGRPVFGKMLQLLRQGDAQGVIIHKIDRSARNLKDWADLGELIDLGVDVHFSNESLNLSTRGGRLTADIQAVVAADYVRNLREETKKGIYGRLKQGIYPLPAPIGYLNTGRGNVKEFDPLKAPLVKRLFELYATGRYSLTQLREESDKLCLRSKSGKVLSRNSLSLMLNNPFYMGLIRIKRTGETFKGIHEPLISPHLYESVQRVLRGKENKKAYTHDFLFRGLFKCKYCGFSMIGEKQKGHVYYRCHQKGCETKGIREEQLDTAVQGVLSCLSFSPLVRERLHSEVEEYLKDAEVSSSSLRENFEMRIGQCESRLNQLTDALLDSLIDKETFKRRKEAILNEEAILRSEMRLTDSGIGKNGPILRNGLELTFTAQQNYISSDVHNKREVLKLFCSNREVAGKEVAVELHPVLKELVDYSNCVHSCLQRYTPRTFDKLIEKIMRFFNTFRNWEN